MNLIIKKRQIIMSALVLALGSAVFVNWYFTRPEAEPVQAEKTEKQSYSVLGDAQYVNASGENTTTTVTDEFAQFKLDREKAHDEAFDKLKEVINDASASKSAVDTAAQQLAQLSNNIKLEADIDALISAKCGFDCLTAINNSKVQIICRKGSLNSSSILQIKEIVMTHAGVSAENITVFETK